MRTKEQNAAYMKAWREANREKLLAKRKAYCEANKEHIAACTKAYREANKEQKAACNKAWYETNREKILAQKKVYNAANRESIAARMKVYNEVNRDERLAQKKVYYEANREQMKVYNAAHPNEHLARVHKHRAQKLGVKIGDTKSILAWLKSWKTPALVACHYCKSLSSGTEMTIDHVIPMSAGGPHDLANLVVCCQSCNSSKQDRLPAVWLARTG